MAIQERSCGSTSCLNGFLSYHNAFCDLSFFFFFLIIHSMILVYHLGATNAIFQTIFKVVWVVYHCRVQLLLGGFHERRVKDEELRNFNLCHFYHSCSSFFLAILLSLIDIYYKISSSQKRQMRKEHYKENHRENPNPVKQKPENTHPTLKSLGEMWAHLKKTVSVNS